MLYSFFWLTLRHLNFMDVSEHSVHLHRWCKQEAIMNVDVTSAFYLAQRKTLSNLTRKWAEKKSA